MLLQRVTFNKNRKKLIFKNDIIAVISKAGNDIKKKKLKEEPGPTPGDSKEGILPFLPDSTCSTKTAPDSRPGGCNPGGCLGPPISFLLHKSRLQDPPARAVPWPACLWPARGEGE